MEDPYLEGKRAFERGVPKSKNPYAGTRDEILWRAGWRHGEKLKQEEKADKAA